MASLVDLAKLQQIFSRRGERVVILLPDSEPVVLVPLMEYERLVGGAPRASQPKLAGKETEQKQISKGNSAPNPKLEAIDPPQGALADDDQYFPEPLE